MPQDLSTDNFAKNASPAEVLAVAAERLSAGVDVCLATVVSHRGSSPSRAGQKMVVSSRGDAVGTVGGGAVEFEVVKRMKLLLDAGQGEPALLSYNLLRDLNMACGGAVEVLVEPMWTATPVLLIGAGHVCTALAKVLSRLQFRVVLTDERAAAVSEQRRQLLGEVELLHGPPSVAEGKVSVRGAVVVATHDHESDLEGVRWALNRGFAYVGGIGSKSKSIKTRRILAEEGLNAEDVDRLRMPVGLSIGASSPEEIAIAIAADLVAWRAGVVPAPMFPQR